MKIALENAKCRRNPNFVPANLKEYSGFKDNAIDQALGRFGAKMNNVKKSLKKENSSFGRRGTLGPE